MTSNKAILKMKVYILTGTMAMALGIATSLSYIAPSAQATGHGIWLQSEEGRKATAPYYQHMRTGVQAAANNLDWDTALVNFGRAISAARKLFLFHESAARDCYNAALNAKKTQKSLLEHKYTLESAESTAHMVWFHMSSIRAYPNKENSLMCTAR